jgi:hypothetical protein
MRVTCRKVRSYITLTHANRTDQVTGRGGCLKLSTHTMPINNMGHKRMATAREEILKMLNIIQYR